MQDWLAGLLAAILTRLTAWLMAQGLAVIHGQEQKAATDQDIDQKLAGFKAAYKEAFDGKPVTPEQRKSLNQAIADFIRSGPPGSV